MSEIKEFTVAAFYKFVSVDDSKLEEHADWLRALATDCELGGLVILAAEGINATVCARHKKLKVFQKAIELRFGLEHSDFKYALSAKPAFKRFKVKLREEIVTTGLESSPKVDGIRSSHLSPSEWHKALSKKDDAYVLDTRNWYETDLGVFRGAKDPRLVNFQEFEDYVKKSDIPKDKEVYMYCTGGIRCEKASLVMEQLGYDKVFQLKGGILKYLEEYPEGHFEGECFVFDKRVAVDKNLEPTKTYVLCPHSGQPGSELITCNQCGKEAKVSEPCLSDPALVTCSKHCANLYREQDS